MSKVPDANLLNSQRRWSYFMTWSEQLRGHYSKAELQATYFTPAFSRG
ncbi:hypothetical protein ACWGF2_19670 [Streptomyces sp. NPDC054919]